LPRRLYYGYHHVDLHAFLISFLISSDQRNFIERRKEGAGRENTWADPDQVLPTANKCADLGESSAPTRRDFLHDSSTLSCLASLRMLRVR
jgi:hypothetical protein